MGYLKNSLYCWISGPSCASWVKSLENALIGHWHQDDRKHLNIMKTNCCTHTCEHMKQSIKNHLAWITVKTVKNVKTTKWTWNPPYGRENTVWPWKIFFVYVSSMGAFSVSKCTPRHALVGCPTQEVQLWGCVWALPCLDCVEGNG